MEMISLSAWMGLIYLVIALFFQIVFISKGGLKIFGRYESTIKLFYKPMLFAMWVIAITYNIEQFFDATNNLKYHSVLDKIETSLLICAFAIGIHSYKTHFLKIVIRKNPLNQDANVLNGINKLLSIAIVIIASLLILDTLGFKSGPLLAFGGVGAAALGFAAKDVISNFFGGLMLVVSRPFGLGDLVLIPEKKIEANVVQVGWYMTTLIDKAKRFIYLPNSAFVHAYIINSSRRTHRKIDSILTLNASSKAQALEALNLARATISSYPGLDQTLKPYVSLDSSEHGIFKIKVNAYTEIRDEKEFYEYQEKLLLTMYENLLAKGLTLPTSHFVMPSLSH